jgi:DNA-binding transcriptional MocR family regulator
MLVDVPDRKLNVDTLVRELGNWRTAGAGGPVYHGLSDGLRMLVVDGRLPVGSRLPSERVLAEALRVSRTTVTAAYAQLRDEGYLNPRRGSRSTVALPIAPSARVGPGDEQPARTVNFAVAAMSAPASAVLDAVSAAAADLGSHLHTTGHEIYGVAPLRAAIAERYCARASHRCRPHHGDHRRARRDRPDPVDIRRAR